MRALIAHASVHGSTAEIAEFMARQLHPLGLELTLAHVDKVDAITAYEAVILGAPIITGVWAKPMMYFLHRFQPLLAQKPTAAWITCIRLLDPNGLEHVTQHYIPTELHNLRLIVPVGLFAGKLDMRTVSPEERWLLNARYDGQPLSIHQTGDFRDWNMIRQWTETLGQALLDVRSATG